MSEHLFRTLPTGWRWVRLGEVTRVVAGSTPDTTVSDFWEGDIVWITPTDLGKLEGSLILDSARHITKAGYENSNTELVPRGSIVLSTRAPIGYLGIADVPLCTNQGCKTLVACSKLDFNYLYFALNKSVPALQALGSGATFGEVSKGQLERFEIPLPPLDEQRHIAAILTEQMAAVEKARAALEEQLNLVPALITSYLRHALSTDRTQRVKLGDCLNEVTAGVGASWSEYPVYGATRAGIALAKEKVGKRPERYKVVDPITVFYNPMRILLGPIAIVDESDKQGITSPDYVVFKGREGVLHSRWFYYWLRSQYGANFIKTLSRGAVRERLLFKRLAAADIDLPSWQAQSKVVDKLKATPDLERGLSDQLEKLNELPATLLRRAFNGEL